MGGYINSGVHKEKTPRIQPCHANKIATVSILTQTKKIGSEAQAPLPPDESPKLDEKGIKRIQQIVGSILYYARSVDMTCLAALVTIAINKKKATKQTMDRSIQLLDYLASNQDAKVRFHASDMVLNIHSDASYLSESGAGSHACGNCFHGIDTEKRGTNTIK